MKVAVVGDGTMGHGIAQVFAMSGFPTIIVGLSEKTLEQAMHRIDASLDKFVHNRRLSEKEKTQAASRLTTTTDIKRCHDCDIVIEAIPEDLYQKRELYQSLDSICDKKTIFASNTSSFRITELAAFTKRPDRFIGLHFFNPAQVMDLVEIIIGRKTSDYTREEVTLLAQKLGKQPVTVLDSPAFVTSRLIMIMINEAAYCLQEKISSKEDIDTAMKLGMNHPLGPFELADFIGLDVVLAVLKSMYSGFGDEKYKPCPLLEEKVKHNELGRKSGKGFYEYR